MNLFLQYQVIKSGLLCGAHCPRCQHNFKVLRKDSQRELTCLKCGHKFKVDGKKKLIRQIKRDK